MLSLAAFKSNSFCRDDSIFFELVTYLLPFFEYLVPSGMECLVLQLLTSQQAISFLFKHE